MTKRNTDGLAKVGFNIDSEHAKCRYCRLFTSRHDSDHAKYGIA